MEYKPDPIDISEAELSGEILELSETLAENVHDVWAKGRIDEGWRHGSKRNDDLKHHPNLVSYQNLPESEMDYDRNTALNTLKAMMALGYQIVPSSRSSSASSTDTPIPIHDPRHLRQPGGMSTLRLPELLQIWHANQGRGQDNGVEFYRDIGRKISRLGEPFLAYDVASEGLAVWPDDVPLKLLLAHSLSQTGARQSANAILRELFDKGNADGETLGLLGSTYKALWNMTPQPEARKVLLEKAAKCYSDAFQYARRHGTIDDEMFSGPNAASMCMLLGREEDAKALAGMARNSSLEKLQMQDDYYWALANLGETAVILGDLDEAEERYTIACQAAEGNLADLSTTRRQARLLLDHLGLDRHQLDHCFGIPRVVVFAGHMIDQPGRPVSRFPATLEKAVYAEIASRLQDMNAGIGYTCAACGSDILFIEAMLERKSEVNIVLPNGETAFRKDSVDIIPDSDWGERFEKVLRQATLVAIANDNSSLTSAAGYEYTYLLQDGLAILRGKVLDTEVLPLAVWNRLPGDGVGGTESFVVHWRSVDREPVIIDTNNLLGQSGTTVAISSGSGKTARQSADAASAHRFPQEIMAMLFCDVEDYTSLTEEEIPSFVENFMGVVEDVLQNSPAGPVFRNTWGDALTCVFSDLRHAGHFALDLRDRIRGIAWEQKGLPRDLNYRMSLHAGPVFAFKDPILKVPNYTGRHVSRTSRIEAVTPPGEIYASEQFAALSSSLGIGDFTFDYKGRVALPKKSGTKRLYLLRRAN